MKVQNQSIESGERVQVVRHAQVCQKLQISSAKLFDLVAHGVFPKPFALIPGGRAVGWLERDVDKWVLDRKAAAHGGGHE
jgi:prophage regulatory protein